MPLFRRPFGRRSTAPEPTAVPEHAVIVYITGLTDDQTGLDTIEDSLIEAIDAAGVGEFDGNEIGPEDARLYMYGPDADKLFAAVEPALRTAPFSPGSHAVVRHGGPGASERRVELA